MSLEPHIADAETKHIVINSNPDFCKVGKVVIPFDIARQLSNEKTGYAKTVFARDEPVLMESSIVKGVVGNAGKGVGSTVAEGSGHVRVIEGSATVFVEDRMLARHGDLCEMNIKI
jgi:Domain of unknown function (DUF4150)